MVIAWLYGYIPKFMGYHHGFTMGFLRSPNFPRHPGFPTGRILAILGILEVVEWEEFRISVGLEPIQLGWYIYINIICYFIIIRIIILYIYTYIYIYIYTYIYILYSYLHRNSIPLAYSFLTQFTFCRIQVKNTTSCRGWITIFAEAIEICNPFISSQLIYTKSTIILCLHILSHTQHPPHVSKNIRAPWCYWYRLVSPFESVAL